LEEAVITGRTLAAGNETANLIFCPCSMIIKRFLDDSSDPVVVSLQRINEGMDFCNTSRQSVTVDTR
jgi:hypothetical protein